MKRVAVVTGGSRGLGRGIARALGSAGMIVYVTGRNQARLDEVVSEIVSSGGVAYGIPCDHSVDLDVQALFMKVRSEAGRLDLLVNNAAEIDVAALTQPGGFWEKPIALSAMLNVGLRSNYVASWYAAPLMIETGESLIVHISYYGAVSYHYGPAYGAAKAGIDKMNFDMAVDLRPYGVASISIWPGSVLTDEIKRIPVEDISDELMQRLARFESPEFTGKIIERLSREPNLMEYTGKTIISAEAGVLFGIKDLNGRQPVVYPELGNPKNRFIFPAVS